MKLLEGAVTAVIGPNGAGKSTLVNVLSGFLRPNEGKIILDGKDISRYPANRRARLGLARTFQQPRLLRDLSILDNVTVSRPDERHSHADRLLAKELLDAFGVAHDLSSRPDHLNFVQRKKVELARCLFGFPRVLLLDELAAGLFTPEARDLIRFVEQRRGDEGLSILLVEHNMDIVWDYADYIYVLDFGRIIAKGDAHAVRADPAVRSAFLGESTGEGEATRAGRSPIKADGPRDLLHAERERIVMKDVNAGYGGSVVLQNLNLTVRRGETIGVIGPNGAGKTTLLRTLIGATDLQGGDIFFDGTSSAKLPIFVRAREGIALVPEEGGIFEELTVRENLAVAIQTPLHRAGDSANASSEAVLRMFPRLVDRITAQASELSGGERKMLSLAMRLVRNPSVLLLDEPSLGLAPKIVTELYGTVAYLRSQQMTMVIAEQAVGAIWPLIDRAVVLRQGRATETLVPKGELDEAEVLARYWS